VVGPSGVSAAGVAVAPLLAVAAASVVEETCVHSTCGLMPRLINFINFFMKLDEETFAGALCQKGAKCVSPYVTRYERKNRKEIGI